MIMQFTYFRIYSNGIEYFYICDKLRFSKYVGHFVARIHIDKVILFISLSDLKLIFCYEWIDLEYISSYRTCYIIYTRITHVGLYNCTCIYVYLLLNSILTQ